MLGKLIKHEMRATGRIMATVLLSVLAVTVVANLFWKIQMPSLKVLVVLYDTVKYLLLAASIIGVIGVGLFSIVVMVKRFYNSFLSNEAYLSLTLPVSVHQHIWSKIIVSMIWFFLTGVVIFLAGIISVLLSGKGISLSEIYFKIIEVFTLAVQQLRAENVSGFMITLFFIESAIMVLLSGIGLCLQAYVSMAIGQTSGSRKILSSVLSYLGISMVSQIVVTVVITLWGVPMLPIDGLQVSTMQAVQSIHSFLLTIIGVDVLLLVLYYLVTTTMLKKRLNLQ
ncbi:MAG: hypothetical protein GX684_03050 [Ruminococcaceae bacterium]|nr:hypothetical protein [Oscillospiraceae bacterium]